MDKRIILFYNCCLLFSYFFFTFSHSAFCISKHYFKNPKNSIIYTQSHASFPSLLHLLFKILPHPTSKAPLTFPLHFFFWFLFISFSLPHFSFSGFLCFLLGSTSQWVSHKTPALIPMPQPQPLPP